MSDEAIEEEDLYLREETVEIEGEKDTYTETVEKLREKNIAIITVMSVYPIVKCVRDVFVMFSSIAVDSIHGRPWCVIKDIAGFVRGKVRDPFFAVAVVACACYGLYSPFEARPLIARIERSWHYVDDLRDPETRIHYQDCRNATWEKDKEGVPRIISRHHYFLLAYCFQPHGFSDDPRYDVRTIT